MRRFMILAVIGLLAAGGPARADDSYAVIFNNTKNDGGFNEAAVAGLTRYEAETGTTARTRVIATEAESLAAMRRFAEAGVGHITLIGFINESAVAQVAPDYPEVKFTLIDGVVEAPNVQSVLFREEEAGFLAGAAAALASRTGTVGFVGAMDIPPIRRFDCGFVQGARHVNPDIQVLRRYLGDDPAVFRDRKLGAEAGRALVADGADVVFAAAGFAGTGVLEAVTDADALGIGVDTNQNGLHPGRILTSAVKRVDVATEKSLKAVRNGTWSPGITRLGLAEDGVDWAVDSHNEALVAGHAAELERLAEAIAMARIVITPPDETTLCALP